jgi:hypothetical protein
VFLVGTAIVLFAVAQAWVILYLLRQAYGMTNKGLIIFRTGLPHPVAQQPDEVHISGLNHAVKMPFEGLFPLELTLYFKSGI